MDNLNFKDGEIKQHIIDNIDYLIDTDTDELHHNLFNTDYYIIGTYKAKQWLGDNAFDVIEYIKDYEQDEFGEVYTDFSEPEEVVNMFTYIKGKEFLHSLDFDYDGQLTQETADEIKDQLKH